MLPPDQMVTAMSAIRDQLFALMAQHERDEHAGAPCWPNRGSAIAFLAHCLGIHAASGLWCWIGDELERYTLNCGENCHPVPQDGDVK